MLSGSRRTPQGIFYGWWIVLAGFLGNFLSGGFFFHVSGVYMVVLEQQFGWGKTVLSGAFSLSRIEGGLLGPISGFFIDRIGPRKVMLVGVVLFGLGLVLTSRITAPIHFYGSFLLITLGSSLSGFLVSITAINSWFHRRRALALGLATTGMGMGGVIAVPTVVWSLSTFGWRPTLFALGCFVWLVGIPLALVMRQAPEKYGLLPDGDSPIKDEQLSGTDSDGHPFGGVWGLTSRQALRTRAFWLIAIGHAAVLLLISGLIVHQVAFLEQQLSFSRSTAANIVVLIVGVMVVGQILGGIIAERIDKRLIVCVCMLGHGVALVILLLANDLPQVLVFAVIHGLAWGIRSTALIALRSDYFGRGAYATITGFNNLVTSVAHIAGPLVAGVVAEVYGTYEPAFYGMAVVVMVASVLFLFVPSPSTSQFLNSR